MTNIRNSADPFDSYMAARLGKPVAQVTAALDADEAHYSPEREAQAHADLIAALPAPPSPRMIWLCGKRYVRCESTFGGLLCADQIGHDGKHHSTWRYWTATEASRETCIRCGMVANVDPSLHAERYGHDPAVRRGGQEHRFDWTTYTFVPAAVPEPLPCRACGHPRAIHYRDGSEQGGGCDGMQIGDAPVRCRCKGYDQPAYQDAMQAAQAGLCSHGGHGWDGDTCSDIPAPPEFADADGHEIAAQLGMGNILAISGGRINVRRTGITLPCGNGYSVTIDLAGNDTYTVRRVFTRAGKAWVKGEMAGVYCDQVGEVAYRAGMFRDEWAAGSAS